MDVYVIKKYQCQTDLDYSTTLVYKPNLYITNLSNLPDTQLFADNRIQNSIAAGVSKNTKHTKYFVDIWNEWTCDRQ